MKKLSSVIILMTLSCFIFSSYAQFTKADTILSPGKTRRMAKKLEKKGSYYNALTFYEQYYKYKPNKKAMVKKIAELQFQLRDYKAAEQWYQLLVDSFLEDYPKSRYWLGVMQKYNGKYDEAKENFTIFIDRYLADDSEEYHELASKQIEGCDLAKNLMADPVRVVITHLDRNVNNPYTDYAPKPTPEDANQLYFSTVRSDTVLDIKVNRKADYYSKIYTTTREDKDNDWQPAQPLEGPINVDDEHTGNGAFSPDGKEYYFTRCDQGKKLKMKCEIYVSKKKGDKWGEPEELSEEINPNKTVNTHPSVGLTSDGKEILYFSSDRDGGIGGFDIWYSESKGKGEWGSPVNLGAAINTAGDESTPYYDSKNRKLYFSSNGQVNIGGYDIYSVEGGESEWGTPTNIGYPINSSVDDMYFYLDEDEKDGYLVSNRPGGFGLKSETCCDDIYEANMIKEVILDGYVASTKDPKTPIGDADVSFFTVNGENLNLISTFKTNEQEHFIVPLDPETVYQVNATKAGYWGSEDVLDMTKLNVKDTLEKVFLMEEIVRRKIKIRRIYYNFDKYNITRQYKVSLDSLYQILAENDSFDLEIRGNTDNIGSDEYNKGLAQRRAQSAADYLMKKGIDKNRLILVAVGESDPIAPNQTEDGKDNPKGRAKNRRVEFKIHTNDPYLEVDIEYEDTERKDTK